MILLKIKMIKITNKFQIFIKTKINLNRLIKMKVYLNLKIFFQQIVFNSRK